MLKVIFHVTPIISTLWLDDSERVLMKRLNISSVSSERRCLMKFHSRPETEHKENWRDLAFKSSSVGSKCGMYNKKQCFISRFTKSYVAKYLTTSNSEKIDSLLKWVTEDRSIIQTNRFVSVYSIFQSVNKLYIGLWYCHVFQVLWL
jgi:hypothetical protein